MQRLHPFSFLHPFIPTITTGGRYNMSTPNNTLRQRGPKDQHKANGKVKDELDSLLVSAKETAVSEWDYKLALTIITILAFVTRFFLISHPNEVVFDEVHFGKVRPQPTAHTTPMLTPSYSLLRTTSSAPTSSMSILPSASSSSLSSAGWSATMAISSSRTSATPTSVTMSHTLPIELCLRFSVR